MPNPAIRKYKTSAECDACVERWRDEVGCERIRANNYQHQLDALLKAVRKAHGLISDVFSRMYDPDKPMKFSECGDARDILRDAIRDFGEDQP